MRKIAPYLAVIVLAAVGGFAFYAFVWMRDAEQQNAITAATTPASLPEVLPEFSLQDRDGKLRSIHSWPGKSLIVNFWATWCEPCQREIPLLIKLNHDRAAAGFQLVGIAVDVREDVLRFADERKLDYPLLIGEEDGLAAINAFGVQTVGFPFTVFTDNRGRIVALHLGEITDEEATAILSAVERVNRGEQTPAQARISIARALNS
jgi:thiol-disulfide isomerase/thioredoxin